MSEVARILECLRERVRAKTIVAGDCWIYTGSRNNAGYGRLRIDDRWVFTHRLIYELLVDPIPQGMTIDHLCRNRACCRPEHLQIVTNRENILRGTSPSARHARKTHCPKGHPYDGANTYITPAGRRHCRTCKREAKAVRRAG